MDLGYRASRRRAVIAVRRVRTLVSPSGTSCSLFTRARGGWRSSVMKTRFSPLLVGHATLTSVVDDGEPPSSIGTQNSCASVRNRC